MVTVELLSKIKETKVGIENAWKLIANLENDMHEQCDELCQNISFDDLRPMNKEDISVGQRFYGRNGEGFYILVIENILGYDD